jgi:hypothetical protein
MGDGTPKGLPLILRFSYLTPALSYGRGGQAVSSILAMENPYPRQLISLMVL